MRLDVIGFGALNLDKLYRVNRIAMAGEEIFVKSLTISPGGSAANTVVGLARLGARTGYIGKLADDPEGEYLLDDLRREEVDTSGISVASKGRSGVCIGFVNDSGERVLYIDPGVNDTLKFSELQPSYADSSEFLHLTSFVGELPFDAQKRLLTSLKKPRVCLDPGEIYASKGLGALRPILRKTTLFLPNEKEMIMITKKDYRNGSKKLLDVGVEMIAVKLGSRGCYVTDGKESHLIPAFPVKPKDTTGAGDAFCAGFIYGLLNYRDLYTCGKLGNLLASRCIRKYGARSGLPSRLDLLKI
ncbi:carbohydrate kinase family protein [Candidatus Bathyarchaeota archaeon]|nr:carbohydrate kinase family protein [Candidatus Bathyarchaeota archaeon]